MRNKFFEIGRVFVLNLFAFLIGVFDDPVLVFDECSAWPSIGVLRPAVNLSVSKNMELLTMVDILIKGLVIRYTLRINLNLTAIFVLSFVIFDVNFSF
jgi:hypothetical protein